MVIPQPVKNHPNASTSAVLSLVSLVVVFAAGRLGAHLTTTQAVGISGAVISGGLRVGKVGGRAAGFFAKRGLIGMWRLILRGEKTP